MIVCCSSPLFYPCTAFSSHCIPRYASLHPLCSHLTLSQLIFVLAERHISLHPSLHCLLFFLPSVSHGLCSLIIGLTVYIEVLRSSPTPALSPIRKHIACHQRDAMVLAGTCTRKTSFSGSGLIMHIIMLDLLEAQGELWDDSKLGAWSVSRRVGIQCRGECRIMGRNAEASKIEGSVKVHYLDSKL